MDDIDYLRISLNLGQLDDRVGLFPAFGGSTTPTAIVDIPVLFVKTGSHYISQADLELTVQTSLTSNSKLHLLLPPKCLGYSRTLQLA